MADFLYLSLSCGNRAIVRVNDISCVTQDGPLSHIFLRDGKPLIANVSIGSLVEFLNGASVVTPYANGQKAGK